MIQANEEWRSVPGYVGIYDVSSIGRVRRAGAGKAAQVGRILRPNINRGGYEYVNLSHESRKATVVIHRAVVKAFIGEPPTPIHQVNHRDGNKLNNSVGNLEWVTKSENAKHAHALGLSVSPFKKKAIARCEDLQRQADQIERRTKEPVTP